MRELGAALTKEALLQWRSRSRVVAILVFGSSALLLFSFAIGPDTSALSRHAPGFLWLALLLSSTLSLSESFRAETDERALEGLLLLPASSHALYYGKAIANAIQLALLGVALVAPMVVLYDAPLPRPWALIGIILLGSAGLAAPGTLYAAMTSQLRADQTLLPLLLFPLVVPVLLASVKASSLLMHGDAMGQVGSWQLLLVAFDVIYWALCGVLFERVVED
jgi:heme exporter protein B